MHLFIYNEVETFIFNLRIIFKIYKNMKDDLGDRMKIKL